ncbi:MAG TPA: dihydrofolate reductase family protein, partial [Actinomycetota bacterium]|nr:dihydrofolate reductase family protein [Actinomycetota bacterium]
GGHLFDRGAPTLVATTAAAPAAATRAWGAAGAEVLVCPEVPSGVDLSDLVKALGARNVLELLVEGGPRLHASFWAAGLADRLVWYLAPLVIGGDGAAGLLPGAGAPTLADARAIRIESIDHLGEDLRVVGYPLERSAGADQRTASGAQPLSRGRGGSSLPPRGPGLQPSGAAPDDSRLRPPEEG